jgi:hypothetical protein
MKNAVLCVVLTRATRRSIPENGIPHIIIATRQQQSLVPKSQYTEAHTKPEVNSRPYH